MINLISVLEQGSGKLSNELIGTLFQTLFSNKTLEKLSDAATLEQHKTSVFERGFIIEEVFKMKNLVRIVSSMSRKIACL